MSSYLRKTFSIIGFLLTLIFTLCIVSCKGSALDIPFTVKFLSVPNGDAVVFNLPNGETLMVDTGDGSEYSNSIIKDALNKSGKDKIDYLILSHPDTAHYGGLNWLIDGFEISKAYLPNIPDTTHFAKYNESLVKLNESGTKTETFSIGKYISGENFTAIFLSPNPNSEVDITSESSINNLSPIIYIDIYGVRIVLSGDAEESEEKFAVNSYKSNLYNALYKSVCKVNLNEVDFLMLGNGGGNNSTCEEYAELLKPKNAVISVSKSAYGSVSSSVIERVCKFSPTASLLRTDVVGSIELEISSNGTFAIKTGDKI